MKSKSFLDVDRDQYELFYTDKTNYHKGNTNPSKSLKALFKSLYFHICQNFCWHYIRKQVTAFCNYLGVTGQYQLLLHFFYRFFIAA